MLSLTLPALLASIGCGLTLAAADYFRKAVPVSVPTATVLFYFLLAQLPLLGVWVTASGGGASVASLGWSYWLPTACDVAASLTGNALFIVAVRRSPLTIMVPMLALVPVLALAFGTVMLGEWPAGAQIAGVGLCAAGVFVLFLPPGAGVNARAMWRNFRGEPGVPPMLGVAVSWALTAPLDKIAVGIAGVSLHGFIQVASMTLAVGVWLVVTRQVLRVARGPGALILGAGLTAGASYALQLVAFSLTLVAFAESIKRVVEIGVTVVVGVAVLRERVTSERSIGIALVGLGIPMMLWPG